MALPKEQICTIKDIYALPEGQRAELIDSCIYYMAPPNRNHQEISGRLHQKILNYLDSKKGNCKAYSSPFAVYLNGDESEYFEPDISVICDPDRLDDKGCKGAPDWIIEITLPGYPSHDYITKLYKYWAAGVREYWIVNPKNQTIFVYFFESESFVEKYTFQDKIKVNIYDDLTIDFSQLDI